MATSRGLFSFLSCYLCCLVAGFHSVPFRVRQRQPLSVISMVLSSPEKDSVLNLRYPLKDSPLQDEATEKKYFNAQQCLHSENTEDSSSSALSLLGDSMDIRRFDTLVHAGPMDWRGIVREEKNDDLDWNTAIFYTVKDPKITQRLQARFGQRPYWPDSVIQQACAKAATLPGRLYRVSPEILNLMMSECEFKNEHADGSFTDHLSFCAEYCARYFPESSPNVLFLHSICGVNTNLFPLELSKIPQLEKFLTAHEYLHIQAFPCMLRLLFGELVDVLWDQQPGKRLDGITITSFHGTKLTLSGDDFWIHLNYHLIHMLDFLPTQNFDQFATTDAFTRLFLRLHELLRTEGKLLADVRVDRLGKVPGMAAEGEDLPTWDHILSRFDEDEIESVHQQFQVQLRRYSDAIDHDLSYELHWK